MDGLHVNLKLHVRRIKMNKKGYIDPGTTITVIGNSVWGYVIGGLTIIGTILIKPFKILYLRFKK